MNIILQIGFYLALTYLGEQLSSLIPFPFPGSVIALILLFIILSLKWLRTEQIKDATHFLLTYMGLFFVPPTVGLLESAGLVAAEWWQFLFVTVATTLITMAVTILVTSFLMKLVKGNKQT